MHAHMNGAHPTTDLPTIAVPSDHAGPLLDELDDLIAVLDEAMADQAAARLVIADTESEQAIIESVADPQCCRAQRGAEAGPVGAGRHPA